MDKFKFLPTLSIGSTGKFVQLLQVVLTLLGYNPGPIDGIFGSRTQAAVMNFQQDHCLTPDGIVGPKTWQALGKALADMCLPPALPTLAVGSSGDAVVLLQTILFLLGFDPGPIDGIFGPLTEMAVENFQIDACLIVDGIVGPKTWTALIKALLKCFF